ncbi:MAG: exosortase H [Phycisphaerales bacterium]|nr:exosortase H [Phycisphaerales bacterium]
MQSRRGPGRPGIPASDSPQGAAYRRLSAAVNLPFVRFVVVFGTLTAIALSLCASKRAYDWVFLPYLQATARVAAFALRCAGEPAEAHGNQLTSARYALRIERGCDAIDPLAMFAAAALAVPASWKRKSIGIVLGAITLALLNLVRVLSLYYVGVHWPRLFETAHIEIWQPLFIIITMLIWLGWASWAISGRTKNETSPPTSAA